MSQVAENKTVEKKVAQTKKIRKNTSQPVRLWVRAKFLGFRRYPPLVIKVQGSTERKSVDSETSRRQRSHRCPMVFRQACRVRLQILQQQEQEV
jgi:hypothetical protein